MFTTVLNNITDAVWSVSEQMAITNQAVAKYAPAFISVGENFTDTIKEFAPTLIGSLRGISNPMDQIVLLADRHLPIFESSMGEVSDSLAAIATMTESDRIIAIERYFAIASLALQMIAYTAQRATESILTLAIGAAMVIVVGIVVGNGLSTYVFTLDKKRNILYYLGAVLIRRLMNLKLLHWCLSSTEVHVASSRKEALGAGMISEGPSSAAAGMGGVGVGAAPALAEIDIEAALRTSRSELPDTETERSFLEESTASSHHMNKIIIGSGSAAHTVAVGDDGRNADRL
jgi:hypothetical protein